MYMYIGLKVHPSTSYESLKFGHQLRNIYVINRFMRKVKKNFEFYSIKLTTCNMSLTECISFFYIVA